MCIPFFDAVISGQQTLYGSSYRLNSGYFLHGTNGVGCLLWIGLAYGQKIAAFTLLFSRVNAAMRLYGMRETLPVDKMVSSKVWNASGEGTDGLFLDGAHETLEVTGRNLIQFGSQAVLDRSADGYADFVDGDAEGIEEGCGAGEKERCHDGRIMGLDIFESVEQEVPAEGVGVNQIN